MLLLAQNRHFYYNFFFWFYKCTNSFRTELHILCIEQHRTESSVKCNNTTETQLKVVTWPCAPVALRGPDSRRRGRSTTFDVGRTCVGDADWRRSRRQTHAGRRRPARQARRATLRRCPSSRTRTRRAPASSVQKTEDLRRRRRAAPAAHWSWDWVDRDWIGDHRTEVTDVRRTVGTTFENPSTPWQLFTKSAAAHRYHCHRLCVRESVCQSSKNNVKATFCSLKTV